MEDVDLIRHIWMIGELSVKAADAEKVPTYTSGKKIFSRQCLMNGLRCVCSLHGHCKEHIVMACMLHRCGPDLERCEKC